MLRIEDKEAARRAVVRVHDVLKVALVVKEPLRRLWAPSTYVRKQCVVRFDGRALLRLFPSQGGGQTEERLQASGGASDGASTEKGLHLGREEASLLALRRADGAPPREVAAAREEVGHAREDHRTACAASL